VSDNAATMVTTTRIHFVFVFMMLSLLNV